MDEKTVQEILGSVSQPSRYLGTEVNRVVKDIESVDLHMVLGYPDLYDIGTSHFGVQILYALLNERENIYAERVFAPAPDLEDLLREKGMPLFSLETRTPLADFDIVGFSLLYELNYTSILSMLSMSGIPFLSSERDDSHPLLVAGGPCAFNPEPVADIFDIIVIGDGEKALLEVAEAVIAWKKSGGSKTELLEAAARIEGVYVPAFYDVTYEPYGETGVDVARVTPKEGQPQRVKRAIIPELSKDSFPEKPVIPFGKPVHDRLRLEISRGCTRGCRFCQASMIYRPVRERSVEDLMEITESSIMTTGYNDVSLLSLSTGDYELLADLMRGITLASCADGEKVAVSLPSIRAGRLTPEIMEIIKNVRKTGFTIAPEAGTQRLRDVINKGITEEDIVGTVESAFSLGWNTIKLYFMIGLPTETQEDLQGIVDLAKKLKGLTRKRVNINVSVSTFIPKPHSVFQWEGQITRDEAWRRICWLRDALKIPGITLKWGSTDISWLEGIWSRGDRRLTSLLIRAWEKGCKLDGWSEHMNLAKWQEAVDEEGIDWAELCERPRSLEEPLPWDHIDSGITREYLEKERNRAIEACVTKDCRYGQCTGCGICDFESIKPVISLPEEGEGKTPAPVRRSFSGTPRKLSFTYAKVGDARYFGHLEFANVMVKVFKRAGIPIETTHGFNPRPKMTFSDPIPLGMESYAEEFVVTVLSDISFDEIKSRLNEHLIEGIEVMTVMPHVKTKGLVDKAFRYEVTADTPVFGDDSLKAFLDMSHFTIEKKGKKGNIKECDLKAFIRDITVRTPSQLTIDIQSVGGVVVRPDLALSHIFSLDEEAVSRLKLVKLCRIDL